MSGQWRQGRRVPRNVYRGDEPIAMVATAEIAAEIVAAGNAREAVSAFEAAVRAVLDEVEYIESQSMLMPPDALRLAASVRAAIADAGVTP